MDWLIRLAERLQRRFRPVRFDSSTLPAETHYAEVYLSAIRRQLEHRPSSVDILDTGCGTGRLLIPLAGDGQRLTGIDWNRDAIRVLKENCRQRSVEAKLFYGDLATELGRIPDESFDVVLAVEWLYGSRNLRALFGELSRVTRRGGVLLASHRTRFHCVLTSLANGQMDEALLVATVSEGHLTKGRLKFYYNWQSSADLEELYASEGLTIVDKMPIGPYSGFAPDPLAAVCDPGALNEVDRSKLLELEMNRYDPETVMAARYVLMTALKG